MITTKQLKCGCAFTYDDDENNEITNFTKGWSCSEDWY